MKLYVRFIRFIFNSLYMVAPQIRSVLQGAMLKTFLPCFLFRSVETLFIRDHVIFIIKLCYLTVVAPSAVCTGFTIVCISRGLRTVEYLLPFALVKSVYKSLSQLGVQIIVKPGPEIDSRIRNTL